MRKNHVLTRMLSVFLVLCIVAAWVLPSAARAAGIEFTQVSNDRVSASLLNKEAADLQDDQPEYAPTDIVRVSIVLNKAATIQAGYSTMDIANNTAAMNYRAKLQVEQENLVTKIEKVTKEKLDVVWNLTLAANIISANVQYGQISSIEKVPGVKSVLIETVYQPDVVSSGAANPNMATSGKQIGSSPAWAAGYTGAGSRIAIIDTGTDIYHQSFSATAFEYSLAYLAGKAGMTVEQYKEQLDLLDAEEIAAKADLLNVTIDAESAYVNSKIPFGYNYVDGDYDIIHLNDNQGEHGSHVSGIATANAYIQNADGTFSAAMDSILVQGVAPDAQLITMKVFGKDGGAYDSDYMVAIEDAIILGCDSINLSLGSGNPGMSRNSKAEYQAILDSLVNSGVVVAMSAGNSGSWVEASKSGTLTNLGVGYLYSDDVSMQTDGSPGSFTNSLAVGSVDNDGTTGMYIKVGDTMIVYNESLAGSDGKAYSNKPLATIAGEHEFVFIDGLGTPEEWAAVGSALEGKIAICSRGEISFFEKAEAAVEAGAIATIIYNNTSGVINMDMSDYSYTQPSVSITQADGAAIKAAATAVTDDAGNVLYYTGTMTVSESVGAGQYNSDYYTMSAFSSWGVPGSLELKPEIVAPGGLINSVAGAWKDTTGEYFTDHKSYEMMSGTSMASPQVAGMAALMAQYIRENDLEAKTGLDTRTLAQSLLMSTAVPVLDGNTGYYYPVLQQGAGLANVGAAVQADSYIMMGKDATASYADGKVKVELGDDPDRTGAYTFTFSINNLTDVEKTYVLSADFFTQDVFYYYANANSSMDELADYMDTYTAPLGAIVTFTVDGKEVGYVGELDGLDFNGDGVVNSADGQCLLDYATGAITELTNAAKADLDEDGDIDSYDAYLFFSFIQGAAVVPANETVEVTVNVQLTGQMYSFYTGQMMAIPIDYLLPNGAYVEGYVYAESLSSEEGVAGTAHSIPVLGFYGNWTDASMFEKGSAAEYTTGDEYRDPYLGKTTANGLTIVYADEPGQNYFFGGNPLIPDDTYMPERNAINGVNGDKIGKFNFAAIRNAAASMFYVYNETTGEVLAQQFPGAVSSAYYHVNVGSWQNTGYSLSTNFTPAGVAEGDVLWTALTLAPEYYVDAQGNVDWAALGEGATFAVPMVVDNTAPTLEDISLSLTSNILTVTASDNQYIAAVVLYNKTGTSALAYTGAKQDIDPKESAQYQLDMNGISGKKFLVQVIDYAMNIVTYELVLESGDEEVVLPDMIAYDLDNGYWTSFSADSTYDQLGVYATSDYTYYAGTIADHYIFATTDSGELHVMPEDDMTDVNVVANLGVTISDMAYNKADGQIYGVVNGYLVTIDKLTGELGIVDQVGVLTNTLACDANGTFYCAQYGTGNVYSFTLDTIAAPTLVCNVNIVSQYVQAMEIDPNNGMLYWASYYVNRYGYAYLFEIDPSTGTYTRHNDLWYELAALLIPEKAAGGDWAQPTDKVSGVQLSANSVSLLKGASTTLSASVQPWTATDRSVTWTSADETIATVDKNGKVTGINTGTTTITATSNLDPSMSASCTVNVLALDITIHGLLQDETGDPMFFDWNMATDDTWTGGVALNTDLTSATVDTLNNKVYVNDASGLKMHLVDPITGAIEKTGVNGTEIPMWDMEYSTVYSTVDAPLVNAVYYYYFFPAKDPMNLDTSVFGLQSYLANYSGASYLVAITSAGYEQITDSKGNILDTEHVLMLDNAGYIWDFWIYPADGGFSASLNFAPTNLAEFGLEFPGNENNMFTSMVYGEDGKLYLSAYTGNTNELYRLTYTADETYVAERIGDFGDNVWPAIITSVESNDADSGDAVVAPKPIMQMEATNVSAEELAAAAAEFETNTMDMVASASNAGKISASNSGSAPAMPMSGSIVDDNEDTVTITITAQDINGANVASTNGVFTVSYDTAALKLNRYAVNGDYSSVVAADGSVTFGYVNVEGFAADDVIATLVFDVIVGDVSSVKVSYKEINNTKLGTDVDVEVEFPHTNTEIRNYQAPTCTKPGYTGDTYCTDCGKLIAHGEPIPSVPHAYQAVKYIGVDTSKVLGVTDLIASSFVEAGNPEHLFDGVVSMHNKWCATDNGSWVAFQTEEPVVLGGYTIYNSSESFARIAGAWHLQRLNTYLVSEEAYKAMSEEEKLAVLANENNWITIHAVTNNTEWQYDAVIAAEDLALAQVYRLVVDQREQYDHDPWSAVRVEELMLYAAAEESTVVAPTCTEQGYTTFICMNCGDSYVDAYVDATGHSFGEWTETKAPSCTDAGEETRSCACGETETRPVPATGHSYNAVVTAPTCTEKGYTTYTCACGDSYVADYVDATGHSFGEWTETKAPTCTEEGSKTRTCACGETETEVIPATGHKCESVVTAPTCTEKGYTTHTCACGYVYVDTFVDATGHTFGEWEETKAPTCTEEGVETRTCHCGETEEQAIAATGHTYESVVTDPTCTEKGFTTHTCHCGDSYVDTYVDALGHTFGEWEETKAPTCTEEGVETRTCHCGETEERAIAATGHTYESVVTDPTCTEKGFTTHTCHCGDSYVDSEVAATGHSFGEWEETKAPTCTEAGVKTRKCACGETEEEAIAATGHKYNSVITAPTVEAEGFTTHTCEHCGDSYVDSYTAKLPKPDPDNSKTGDSSMVHLWALGMLCSVVALGTLVIYRKRSYKA